MELQENLYLEFSNSLKIKSKIREITKDELKKADEVFLTGTAAEITPVNQNRI